MRFGSIDHKTGTSQELMHQICVLPNAGWVHSIHNYVVEIHDNGNVHAIYYSSYCALEMRMGIRQPKL